MSRSPVSAAEGSLGSGTKCAAFEKRLTMVNITVWPLEDASLVMKSMAIWDQGCRGIGSGFRRSLGWCEDFPCAHSGQAATKALVSRAMDSHQKHCCGRCSVRLSPGLHGSLYTCPHCRTSEQAESGTNRVLGGVTPGSGVERSASRTHSSTSQMATPTTQEKGGWARAQSRAGLQRTGMTGRLACHS